MTEFFMPMLPPTVTAQEKELGIRKNGKPFLHDSYEIRDAKQKLLAHLSGHVPAEKYIVPVRLTVKWLFPATGNHKSGEYKGTRPDTDNLQKMLKDCMTNAGFWQDDALVASEITEKFYADTTGIYIRIEALV